MSASRWRHRWRRALLCFLAIFMVGLLWPEPRMMPVADAGPDDYHPNSFWYSPWGRSGVHKGIDIFAPRGTPAQSATEGIVLYRGELELGGKVVLVLGPKWRLHYFAHLDALDANAGWLLSRGETVGRVGDSGNARGKAPHLHYSKLSLLPLPWRYRPVEQGWKRLFFVDPSETW